ncbi:DUF2950 family protein [Sedimentitalea sp. JM2-8]|uniref:DUF2950 family protein n=1 Tax=Sedimentitalea xiamensis TaxID=3050037 RepID=A0ABT7FC26_9RHOB|nr:DUF2950 family protein [Sedimentitalea xiamensis]MDK3072500.1 DUF2950 family protein [Sedimentitalea xiamensis]
MKRIFVSGLTIASLSATALVAEPAIYGSPTDTVMAFMDALNASDQEALLTVFGPENRDLLLSGDSVEDRINRIAILTMYREGYRLEPQDDGSVVLALGEDGWPFPVPIARTGDGWGFDADAGYAEVTAREIGGNELDVIDLLDAYGDVQMAFRLVDQDGDGVMEFARRIISSAEDRDGLFWPGQNSPMGANLARASVFGYNDGVEDRSPEPFGGYYFRILEGQTDAAPGGAMSYLVNDQMVGGHALLAVPANYGESGVHSFMVSENGVILQADLGENTLELAADMTLYDPTGDWSPVED